MTFKITTVILFHKLKEIFNAKRTFIETVIIRFCYLINHTLYFVAIYGMMFVFITMLLVKSNEIYVMKITILMMETSSVFYQKIMKKRNSLFLSFPLSKIVKKVIIRKNMRITGHKQILSSKSLNRTVTYLQYSCKSNVHKRNMTRFHGLTTRLIPSKKLINITQRNLPDQGYIGVKVESKIIGKDLKTGHNIYESEVVTSKGQPLPLHEHSHTIVRDNETGKDIGLLTSAKSSQKGNINIAPENYKGDLLPNGMHKPQQFTPYKIPRYTGHLTNVKEDPQVTLFLQKYDKQLNAAVKQTNNHKQPALARLNKNSSQLYHEDGKPIYDNNGNEIEYDK